MRQTESAGIRFKVPATNQTKCCHQAHILPPGTTRKSIFFFFHRHKSWARSTRKADLKKSFGEDVNYLPSRIALIFHPVVLPPPLLGLLQGAVVTYWTFTFSYSDSNSTINTIIWRTCALVYLQPSHSTHDTT